MQADLGSLKSREDCPQRIRQAYLTCIGCGKPYQKPILARVSAGSHSQIYQACPHCMTRVSSTISKAEDQTVVTKKKEPKDSPPASEKKGECSHFFGYLNKRQKATPIPELCLTCTKMVDCLYGQIDQQSSKLAKEETA